MRRYATAVRGQLEAGALDGPTTTAAAQAIAPGEQAAPDPAGQIADSMPTDGLGEASTGTEEDPFVGRDPIVSLLQTSVEAKLHEEGLVSDEAPHPDGHGFLSRLWHKIEGFVHPTKYGPDDPEWVTEVAKAMLDRLAQGNHPFNPVPAEHEIADDARIVVVGDWGSGLKRAQARRRPHGRRGPRRPRARPPGARRAPRRRVLLRRPARSTTATCSTTDGGRSPPRTPGAG